MKTYRVVLFAGLLLGCGQSQKPEKNDSVHAVQSVTPSITDVRPVRPNIEYTPWDGGLHDAIYWKDKRGENIVVISGEGQYYWEQNRPELKSKLAQNQDPKKFSEVTQLFARHYILPVGGAQWKLFYNYEDQLFGCCDVYMEYQPNTLTIIDADSSGTGDVVFMYHSADGKGKADSTWNGHLVMLKDSVEYRSSGITGMAAVSDYSIVPGDAPYGNILSELWMNYREAWKKQMRTPDTLTSTPEGIHVDRAN